MPETPRFLGPKPEIGPEKLPEYTDEQLPPKLCNACREKGDGCQYLNLQNNFESPPEDQRIWYETIGCPNLPKK